MWRECQPTGCSGAVCSRTSPPHQDRVSSCCASGAMPTPRASAGRVRISSPRRPVCSALASARRSMRSWRRASSSNSRRAARAAGTRRTISSSSRASYGPLGSPYFWASYGPLGMQYVESGYGPLGGHEVNTSHGDESSELQSRRGCSSRIGPLAARWPSAEEAQGEVTSGARQGVQTAQPLPAWSRLLRADEGEVATGSRPSAGRRRTGGSLGAQRNSRTRVGFARSFAVSAEGRS